MTKTKTQAPSASKRSFTWGLKTTEIDFMKLGPAEGVIDGNPVGCDCGCGGGDVLPRQQRTPGAPKTRTR